METIRLGEATLDDLKAGLESGRFNSVDLCQAYIARIKEVNQQLRAVEQINPDGLRIARALDDERAAGKVRGPLHGIPVLLMHTAGTKDKLGTTAGSFALVDAKVREDSTLAAKLRAAGAVILGKAHGGQWCAYRSDWPASTNGWSAICGQAHSPFVKNGDPWGSSTGAAIGATLGLCWAAQGEDTVGSMLTPAGFHNAVAIRPTVGLVSRRGTVWLSKEYGTVGPMARTVKDAAYFLQAVAGRDPGDQKTLDIPLGANGALPNYVAACQPTGLRGRRIGVARSLYHATTFVNEPIPADLMSLFDAAMDSAIDAMRGLGATVVDEVEAAEGYKEMRRLSARGEHLVSGTLAAEMVEGIAEYFGGLEENPHGIRTLADLREFTMRHPNEEGRTRGTGWWDDALRTGYAVGTPEFHERVARAEQLAGPHGILGAMEKHSLDALIVPSWAGALMLAALRAPGIVVPLGKLGDETPIVKSHDMNRKMLTAAPNTPFGLMFMGRRWEEEKLISMAYAFEQRTQARREVRPICEPSTDLADIVEAKRGGGSYVQDGRGRA